MRIVIHRAGSPAHADSESARMGILAAQTRCPARHPQGAVMLDAIRVGERTVEYTFEVCCADGGHVLRGTLGGP